MRQTYRQRFHFQRLLRRHQFPIDPKPAFPIEFFPTVQIPLRCGHDVAGPRLRLTRRFAATDDARDGNAEFETDEVVGFELCCVLDKSFFLVRLEIW